MNIIQVTRQSPWQHIADITSLLIEQMKAIGRVVVDRQVKTAMENALKPGTSARFFLCLDENQAVACCVINIGSGIDAGGDYIWINEFHVHEDKRRQGIGRALLNHILQWAKEEGYGYIAGVTQPSNEAAQMLFKDSGFESSEMAWLERR